MELEITQLKERYDQLIAEKGSLRIREAAKQLEVSEVEILVLRCGNGVIRLKNSFAELLSEVEGLGKVMALSRNDEAVHERKGVYLNGDFSNPHGSVFVGKDIDLRFFLSVWDSAFAVTEMNQDKERFSLQFFGKEGEAIHKIYMEPTSNLDAYQALVANYRSEDQSPFQLVDKTAIPEKTETPDSEIDVKGFQLAWGNLKDTHAFFGILRRFGVSRTQALRLAPSPYFAQKTDHLALRRMLNLAAQTQVSIMVFIGNKGMIQIHTGPVKNIVDHGPWINVLDPDFNMHLREDLIAETWIVRKPTEDGIVTSLEIFNAKKELICTLFGERKPGIPELEGWREMIEAIQL